MARAHTPRNKFLVPGITRFSRSKMYGKRGLYKRNKVSQTKVDTKESLTKTVQIKGDKNGGQRTVPLHKAPRFYPAEDVPQPKKSRKTAKPTKLRASITPGTVLILLNGRFHGKRVVFLKQLAPSGLLLVTGPYKINGVPLRRVNQAYVIATSTKINIEGISLDKFDDSYFKKEKDSNKKDEPHGADADSNDQKEAKKKQRPETKVADQKDVDKLVIAAIKKEAHLQDYLHSRFSLAKGVFPHLLKF